jgi:hypothetical protein
VLSIRRTTDLFLMPQRSAPIIQGSRTLDSERPPTSTHDPQPSSAQDTTLPLIGPHPNTLVHSRPVNRPTTRNDLRRLKAAGNRTTTAGHQCSRHALDFHRSARPAVTWNAQDPRQILQFVQAEERPTYYLGGLGP